MSTTRILAKEAAFKLLQKGERPTADRVRAAIGQGAQQTILAALDDFWGEVGARLCEPRLPESLVEPVNAIWSQAVVEAGRQWQSERAGFEERIRELEEAAGRVRRELEETHQRLQKGQQSLLETQAHVGRLETEIAERDQALKAQGEDVRALKEESARLLNQRDQLKELLALEREGRERDQGAWMKEIDAARQSLKSVNGERDRLSRALAEARDAKVRQDLSIEGLERANQGLESRLQTSQSDCERLAVQSEERSSRIGRLELQVSETLKERDAWRERCRIEAAGRAELETEAQAARIRSERLGAENQVLRDEISALRANRAEIERFFQQAMEQIGERGQ